MNRSSRGWNINGPNDQIQRCIRTFINLVPVCSSTKYHSEQFCHTSYAAFLSSLATFISLLWRLLVFITLPTLIYTAAKKTPVRATPRYDPASVYGPSVARRSKENARFDQSQVIMSHMIYIYIYIYKHHSVTSSHIYTIHVSFI